MSRQAWRIIRDAAISNTLGSLLAVALIVGLAAGALAETTPFYSTDEQGDVAFVGQGPIHGALGQIDRGAVQFDGESHCVPVCTPDMSILPTVETSVSFLSVYRLAKPEHVSRKSRTITPEPIPPRSLMHD
jgi:hypothetical protein